MEFTCGRAEHEKSRNWPALSEIHLFHVGIKTGDRGQTFCRLLGDEKRCLRPADARS